MVQEELFALERTPQPSSIAVPGFTLSMHYVGAEEEHELLAHVESGPWESDWRRRIQQYGLGYAGRHGAQPSWVRDFPEWLVPLARRVAQDASFERFPENCVVNEYIPPLGIAPHRDYGAFGDKIACVSLGSDVVMDFKKPGTGAHTSVHVPARSLWVISGEARWQWQHGIAPRLTDFIHGERRRRERRVSITFRLARDPVRPKMEGAATTGFK